MQYNSERKPLIIPEYGRYIHQMVDYCVTIKDIEQRNKVAKKIIDIMGILSPHLRNVEDFKHKLWDQLFIMSDFKLEVDSPYPKPVGLTRIPSGLNYPKKPQRFRFYGQHLQLMIKSLNAIPEESQQQIGAIVVAKHMKKSYLTWNKDTVDDAVILQHLYEISENKIDIRNKNIVLGKSKAYYLGKKPFVKNNNIHSNRKKQKKKL